MLNTTTEVVVTPLNSSFTYGDDITFTVISPVSPATVAPDAGTVSITADGVPIADCQLLDVSVGTATCTTDASDAGIPSISASFWVRPASTPVRAPARYYRSRRHR